MSGEAMCSSGLKGSAGTVTAHHQMLNMVSFFGRHMPQRHRYRHRNSQDDKDEHKNGNGKIEEAPKPPEVQRGSWSGTPLVDTPEQQSLRSSYASGVVQAGGAVAPGAPLAAQAALGALAVTPADAERTPVVRAADVHSSLHADVDVLASGDSLERAPLLRASLASAGSASALSDPLSDPFRTPERSLDPVPPVISELRELHEDASGHSTPSHYSSSRSTPAPLSPTSSPPASPPLPPQRKHLHLPATPQASFRPLSRSPPGSRPASALARTSYRPRSHSISPSTSPSEDETPQHCETHNHKTPNETPGHSETRNHKTPGETPKHKLHMPRPRRSHSSSSEGSEGEDAGDGKPGLRALDIKADSDEMAAGTRSLAWVEELQPFHGPVPASLIGGRFPPVELMSGDAALPRGWPLARARQLPSPRVGLKRVGSKLSLRSRASSRGSRPGSRAGSRPGSRSGSPPPPLPALPYLPDAASSHVSPGSPSHAPTGSFNAAEAGEHFADSTFGAAASDAEAGAADGGESVHSVAGVRGRARRSTDDWAPPHALARRLSLGAPRSGRTYSAARLGALGARKVVKFFLGPESHSAQAEARAYEVLDGTGLTPRWHGVWGGFHPHIGHKKLRAGQVLLLACVMGDAGEDVVVDKLWKKEKRAIVKLYHALHAAGVLHNCPGPEHWQRGKNGDFKLVSFSQALFRDKLPGDIWAEAVEAEDQLVLGMLGLSED